MQIDVPEELGLAQRGSFYEATGAYRDMVVTHLFQVMAFMAMEPPTSLEPQAITEEKNKVFRSMMPIMPENVVRGQFHGYRDLDGVAALAAVTVSACSTSVGGAPVATFVPDGLTTETALLCVEVYRRQGAWKVRALAQGYAGGLAQLAQAWPDGIRWGEVLEELVTGHATVLVSGATGSGGSARR